jgi:hypothetical protein
MLIHGGSSPSIWLGPTAYGISERITIRDHVITNEIRGMPGMATLLDGNFTYRGNGIFRMAVPNFLPHYWLVPGAVGIIRTVGPYFDHHIFKILSVRSENGQPKGPILIETDIKGGGLPAVSGYANAGIVRHNAPNLTVVNCTGCPDAEELSLAPPNSPYGIISRRTYTGAPHQPRGTSGSYLCGRLVHLKINVVQPYTGVAPRLTFALGQFGYWVINADKSVTRSSIRVNCRIAGERIITTKGVSGAQEGDDALADLAGGVWMPKALGAFFSAGSNNGTPIDISGEDASLRPIVTVEALTDQEF